MSLYSLSSTGLPVQCYRQKIVFTGALLFVKFTLLTSISYSDIIKMNNHSNVSSVSLNFD